MMEALIGTLAAIPICFAMGWWGPRLLDKIFGDGLPKDRDPRW
jgi:hypothetical protein